MAKNPNERLDARHVIYCAGTGGGKTTAIHNLGLIPKKEDVVIFDTYGTFNRLGGRAVHKAHTLSVFYKKLVKLRAGKKPFVLAFVGGRTYKQFELFNKMVWGVADGSKALHIVYEELIRFVTSTAKAEGMLAEIYQGGRKFGLVAHAVFQRGQEVPKTVLRGSQIKWVGKCDGKQDAKYWENEIDVPANDIANLKPLEYYLKFAGIGNVEKGKLRPLGFKPDKLKQGKLSA